MVSPVEKKPNHQELSTTVDAGTVPHMLDIGSGSRTLLADAFTICCWITTTIDSNMESEKSYDEAKRHAEKTLLICATFPCDGAPNL